MEEYLIGTLLKLMECQFKNVNGKVRDMASLKNTYYFSFSVNVR